MRNIKTDDNEVDGYGKDGGYCGAKDKEDGSLGAEI